MKIFRNRTVIGVLCILLALIICFGVTPLFSRSASEKTEIVRVTKDIREGDEITAEMVQTVMACQTDRSLTSILTPIVSKLSDMRVVNAELENLVFGPRKEFITMAILVLIIIPLVRFINKDWYHTLVATIPGQMVIAVCLAAVFVSFAFVVKLTQPIEYRR